jgi:hypothetical protein
VHADNVGPENSDESPSDPLTKLTETLSVVSVSDSVQVSPKFSPAPDPAWPPRPAEIGDWPIPLRQRWGELSNQFEDEGVPFPDSERQAYHQVKAEMGAS